MFSFKYNYKNFLISSWIIILLVLYIFNIIPYFGMDKVGTRIYLSLISLFLVLYKYCNNKYYRLIIIANWSQMVLSVIAALVNGTTDFWYVQFGLRNILYFNGALMIASCLPSSWSFYDFIKLIVIAIIVNSVIATISFFFPPVANFLMSIQNFRDDEQMESLIKWSVRMAGLGCGKFFVGGMINGMGIILTFYLIAKKEINLIAGILFLFILFFVGVFIARTTIVGFLIGLLLYMLYTDISRSFVLSILLIFIVVVAFSFGLFDSINTSHAFEFFTFDENAYEESTSLSSLRNMYNIDLNAYTLFIGDGLSKGGGFIYYMGTDVGWLRNILYFGLLGTIFGYLYYECKIHMVLHKLSGETKWFSALWFLYLLILNFKGLPDFNFMIFLLISYFLKIREAKNISAVGLKRQIRYDSDYNFRWYKRNKYAVQ